MTSLSQYGFDDALSTADFLRARIPYLPKVALLTGTGLGEMTSSAKIDAAISYQDIPLFPVSTVQSHDGRLAAGVMNGRPLLILQGRCHLYEGYMPKVVSFPIRVLRALGVQTLILTNASGGLNPLFAAGDIMIIEDHINLTGENPLAGPNDERLGPRFPEMANAYNGRLQDLAQSASEALEVGVQKGVYAGLKGPCLETPAEMRFLRTIGADAVGFSTVMETIAAVHAGMQVLGLSVITNMCLPDALAPANVDDIIAVARLSAPHMETIITAVLEDVDE